MAQTEYFKWRNRYAGICTSGLYLSTHSDVVKAAGVGTAYYYNKNVVFTHLWNLSSINTAVSANPNNTGIAFSTALYSEEEGYVKTADLISASYVSASYNDDNTCTLRFTINNSSDSPIEVKSVLYNSTISAYRNSIGTNIGTTTATLLYYNLATPVVVPANDAIIVDVTFSFGDISSVSQG